MKFLLSSLVLFLFSFLVVSIDNDENEIKKSSNFEFSTFTSAVCENKNDLVYCRDELFVNCNGEVSKAVDFVECNDIKMNAPKVTGFAVFEKGWKDPRN